ncbi:hypothetical protein BN7_5139 [Wickerhamomyces ciferrii]|uniref:CP-type G domain-containing protein n=1 Tax=Wickerhamomyces ciferrii (strain ATCC 14091 / BCRC 22168 / CBS 111 / JCM 3599 / NBRC 0793 / NRRL Y-1031 F-60-10) TaxID=1206466 RepID=K0KU56_WICCF|nr:uncharacterized protein BN7_5139 [Wickerhamomyces ciferrii]CCH45557.1 hypothetical protein BN7_5139 [Wickerhamomyces ciferrii]
MTSLVRKFIPRTSFPDYRVSLTDFKGHHVKALNKLTQIAPQLDLVFEVRDARAPLSTRNVLFEKILGNKPKVVLYSKKDLSTIDVELLTKWHKDEKFMFVNCKSRTDATNIIEIAKAHYEEMEPRPPLGLRMIITGMPNVGKSTLVNTLRAVGLNSTRKVAKTGGQPGVTRSTSSIIKINENPEILLYDTPGVFIPRVENSERMIVLSLVGAVSPTIVDPVIQADYLLYLINLQNPTLYSQYLKTPTNDVYTLLRAISKKIKKYNSRTKDFDEKGTALHWIDGFKQGKTGRLKFDVDSIVKSDIFDYQAHQKQEIERLSQMDNVLNKKKNTDGKRSLAEKVSRNVNKLF